MSSPPSKESRSSVLALIHDVKTLSLKLYSAGLFSKSDLQIVRQTFYMAGAEIAQKTGLPCRDCQVPGVDESQ